MVAEGEVGVLVGVEDVLQHLQLVGGCPFPLLLVQEAAAATAGLHRLACGVGVGVLDDCQVVLF